MNKFVNYIKWHWKNEMMYFLFIQVLYVFIIGAILLGSSGKLGAEELTKFDDRKASVTFQAEYKEVHQFYLETVGGKITTQTVEILDWDKNSSVLAYCRPSYDNLYPKYITFNHKLINELYGNNPDVMFQIILHEYVHCEGGIGHIQMPNHFMNDGGNNKLTKAETKKQFVDFLEYYRKFYNYQPKVKKDDGAVVPQ